MSTEDNKALARRWLEEVWNQGDLSLVDELIADNYVLHDPTRPGLKGRISETLLSPLHLMLAMAKIAKTPGISREDLL